MKREYILNHIRYFMGAAAGFMLVLLGVILLQDAGQTRFRLLSAFLAAVCLLIVWYGYRKIYQPLMKNNRVKTLFARGDSYGDIYHMDCMVSAGEEAMLRRFESLMDKNRLIGISMKTSEYLALQNQINPHFLYNTLEGIRAEAVLSGMDSIAEMTEALATYFRYTISQVNNLVTLEEELANVENYYYIQQFRFGGKLQLCISYDCEEEEEALRCQLPKLTLQPIVENSIYHGLEQKIGKGCLSIKVSMTDSHLIILVSDDGVGMKKEQVKQMNETLRALRLTDEEQESMGAGSGIAVRNVNDRIKLMFGEAYGIYMYSQPGAGTDVEITLPVVKG